MTDLPRRLAGRVEFGERVREGLSTHGFEP
jgi:hypothetical protein